jgi:hypothetical protein
VVLDVGAVIADHMEQQIIRPLDLAYYVNEEGKIVFIDHAVVDKIMPFIRSSSAVLLLFFIANTKGGSNTAYEDGFTYAELMKGTGIKSRATMFEALAELGDGLPATKNRREIRGWKLIIHTNDKKKSKYVRGNRWRLNTEVVIEGVAHKLFMSGKHGHYFMMHPWIINTLFPTLTPNQVVIFMFIYRLTLGWQREENSITYNFFTGARRDVDGEPAEPPKRQSGLTSYNGVKVVVQQLVDLGLIFVKDGDDPRYGRIYSLNKDLFITIEARGQVNHPRGQVNQDARSGESPARSDESSARSMTPQYSASKQSFQTFGETPSLRPPAQNGSFGLHETLPPLQNTTEGTQLPESGETPAPMSRTAREAILKHTLGIKRKENLDKALELLEQGYRNDSHIEMAIKHKEKNPKTGGGVYSNYFTMKPKSDGTMYELFDMESPSENPSVGNEPDAAPNSAPPTNGNGAAPDLSPTPTYTNGNGRAAEPPTNGFGVAIEHAKAWNEAKEMLKGALGMASYNAILPYAKLVAVEGNKFVVAAPPRTCENLKQLTNTIHRALHGVTGSREWVIEFVSNQNQKETL